MEDCLFCKIIKGDIPSYKVYEDELCFAFLDINPSTNGHILLIPKNHYDNILDVDLEFIKHAFKIIKEILYPLLKEKLDCDGLTISENNFYGQEIKHFHIHLTPRYENDVLEHNFNKEILEDVENIYNKLVV